MTASESAPILLGLPYDASSSFMRGPALAPEAVRRVLYSGSGNWTTELGVELDPALGTWTDAGDLELPDDPIGAQEAIRTAVRPFRGPVLALGGDHFVTVPLVAELSTRYPDITIVHVDAHPDLYDVLEGDRLSHACPMARIMEASHAGRLVQLGIRCLTAHQHEQVERFGVEIHTAAGWDGVLPPLSGHIYLSIDVDGLDPAHAPGVSHHEPGGLTTRQVLGLIHQIDEMSDVRVVGADVVEINPRRDIHDMTAALGAKLIKELLGVMVH
ncbi:MAG: agmatinase [Actinomycetia bacterium]|nr:agmatinase [Actinomycetes bacterium]